MVDDSIRREIEENNERQNDLQEDQAGLPGLLDDALSPVTDAIERAGSDVDKQDLDDRAAENDADQRA